MKLHQLTIQAYSRPEVLERVLRVVRHRGFQLHAINMEKTSSADSELQIAVIVASERPLHLLQSQLAKLIDVIHVESAEAPVLAADSFPIRA